jgi:hypothetical protein
MKYEQLNSVFVIYSRHGWTLRRILTRKERLEDVRERGGVEVFESDIDAAWFSRQSKPGVTTWEIRSLEGDQYRGGGHPLRTRGEDAREIEERLFGFDMTKRLTTNFHLCKLRSTR